ncbi:MAG: PaaI family thioesterase [SAR86 cluster bacterium]|nr:PaaI family thioesterase [SAR86 cluster bacterium]MDG2020241.1 PaaI family thioesterase [SAR86 cluster bacterium]|tara:strand:- start:1847 stop:2263 length:417 start_codon:yes stop_codon:yes gene_type:complete
MEDSEILQSLQSDSAPCTDTLGAKVVRFSTEPPEIEMEFEAIYDFTHSDGQVVQGGFVAGMLDAPMAHLLMGLFNFKIIPMTLDLNVSYLAPSRQGKLNCIAEVLQLGKSTAFMTSKLYQQGTLVASATSTVRLVSRN